MVPQRYDDSGFTGGNLERPALKRLLEDVDARHIQCVVVYKVDRLSRSLLDFARLIDRFELRSVSFVPVTQRFNTTTSLGRLTIETSCFRLRSSSGRSSGSARATRSPRLGARASGRVYEGGLGMKKLGLHYGSAAIQVLLTPGLSALQHMLCQPEGIATCRNLVEQVLQRAPLS